MMPLSLALLRWCYHDRTRLEVGQSITITSATILMFARAFIKPFWNHNHFEMIVPINVGSILLVHHRRIDFNHAYQTNYLFNIYPSYRSSRTCLSAQHTTPQTPMLERMYRAIRRKGDGGEMRVCEEEWKRQWREGEGKRKE